MHKDGIKKQLLGGSYTLISDKDENIEERVYLNVPKKKDVGAGLGGWLVIWQEAAMQLAGDKRLNFTDLRVILVLQARLDFENWIRLSLSEIGEPIKVARTHISVSMKKLLEMQVVLPGPSVKNIKTYRLNPAIGWKGELRQGATERRRSLKLVQGGKVETHTEVTQPTLPF